MTGWFFISEIMEILSSQKKFEKWKSWRVGQIRRDIQNCHPKCPDEEEFLVSEIKQIEDKLPSYFSDGWNYIDWVTYFLCVVVTVCI